MVKFTNRERYLNVVYLLTAKTEQRHERSVTIALLMELGLRYFGMPVYANTRYSKLFSFGPK